MFSFLPRNICWYYMYELVISKKYFNNKHIDHIYLRKNSNVYGHYYETCQHEYYNISSIFV